MAKKKNKFVSAFEQFGRSFLLPVSVLPGAGIIKGIGTAFTNSNTLKMFPALNNSVVQFIMKFFIALGDTAFDNLPIIFAVGVAVGLAKREKGSAALSGLLGFIVLHYILNFLLKFSGKLVDTSKMSGNDAKLALSNAMQTKVLGIQTMDLSVFGGIIVGIVVYFVHMWAVKVQLPTVVGFFSGPRFVPIATMVVMAAVASGLFFIWPPIQKGISVLSVFILKSGPIGTFLYGLLERALLPFGLHHGLNWPVRTTELGGAWEIGGKRVVGTINAYLASLADPNIKHVDPNITRFTEPIEFTFLFVAPILYIVHAFLAGSALFVMHMLGAGVATPTGHGFINWVIYGVLQGPKTKWWLVPLVGIVYFFIYYVVFRFMIVKFDLKTPGREDSDEVRLSNKNEARAKYGVEIATIGKETKEVKVEETSSDEVMETVPKTKEGIHKQAVALVKAHGGPDNIEAVDACITRLRINVKDKSLVDQNTITKKLGAMGFAESDMQMQSIYGAHANVLKMEIQDMLGMEE